MSEPPGKDGVPAMLAALDLLGRRDVLGLVWVDAAMTVTGKHGRLAADVEIGRPITEALPVLVGQEPRLASLRPETDDVLVLANVAMFRSGDVGDPVRLDVSVHPDQQGCLIALGRVLGAGEIERVVENEIRQRRIADAELARIVAHLEEFTYVISHDLMAPLRAMRYFAGETVEALESDPPRLDTARTHASDIAVQTRRMSNMLQGLLAYARIGRRHEAIETVATHSLVRDVVTSLAATSPIEITIAGEWPTLKTAPAALDLVLRNLIDNALKHHDRAQGRVSVEGRSNQAGWRFTVADDGPGIPQEWQEAVFQPFRRIDDRHAPDSSGIGLALVRRTIEGIGGRITLNSNPPTSRGTAFTVTWPVA